MAILSIDHVQLAMPEGGEEEARRFYRDLLGILEVAKPSHLEERGGCWFENGEVKLHLGVERAFRPARKAHPALIVSEIGALTAAIAEAGFQVVEVEPRDGYARAYADDPFGNRIELMGPLDEPEQRSG
jgi:catechol 2,3-dioxygenase-like lactoylglutathione lyase family enzyme